MPAFRTQTDVASWTDRNDMDAIELARREAEHLHKEGIARGDDPWMPYDFVVLQAKRKGLTVNAVRAESPILDGALARYEPDSNLIVHAIAGSTFEQAVYVAHELGHALLGDGAPDQACEIDASRPAELAPVGEDRVIDYSRRQRREVQMDLFARELILPRSIARDRHVRDGMKASAIALKLGAPFTVVAQQLLDALLLPVIEAQPEAPKSIRTLDPSQAFAASHRGGPMLLEAGPGTGKTQTLVGRIDGLLSDGADPRTFLVLTFSNKAAGELSDRISETRPDDAAAMWVGTFHAFGLDLVRRNHEALGFSKEPRLMDRAEAIDLLQDEFTRLDLVHYRDLWNPSRKLAEILKAISRAQDELVGPDRYHELADAMLRSAGTDVEKRVAAEKCIEVSRVYALYQSIKRREEAVDFGDLITFPVDLIAGHPDVLDALKARYHHVLVDEYQDVNRASVRLLELLSPTGDNLWVVGDVRQSIYRFRGASPFNVDRFGLEDFPGGVRPRLETNYRSVGEIVGAYSRFATEMTAGKGRVSSLTASRGDSHHPVEHRRFLDNTCEAPALADAILDMREAGYAFRDQAILCSGNDRLGRLGAELERRGVPVLYLGSLFERPEVQDLLSLLSLLGDPRAMGLVRATPLSDGLTLGDVQAVLSHLRETPTQPMFWGAPPIAEISAAGGAALKRIAAALSGFTASDNPWTILATLLLDRTRLAAEISQAEGAAGRSRGIAIWQFMNFVRVQPGQGSHEPVRHLLDRIRRLVALSDERDLRQLPAAAQGIDAVRLMTMHGSKGLEFKVVHVPGMNNQGLPRTFIPPTCPPPDGLIGEPDVPALVTLKASHEDEQECLFYVALSRARDRLILYSAIQQKTTEGRKPAARQASTFVARVMQSAEIRVTPTFEPDLAPEDAPIELRLSTRASLALHELAQYEGCPRRFLYSVLIAIGGGPGARSAFVVLHDLVRDVIEQIVREGEHGDASTLLDAVWTESDLKEHGYAEEFRRIAEGLVGYYLDSRRGLKGRASDRLIAVLTDGDVHLTPDEILEREDGRLVFRRIKTGHRSKTSASRKSEAIFPMAVAQMFPGAEAEIVYLGDGEIDTRTMLDSKKTAERRKAMDGLIADIGQGRFPTKESVFTCPTCPAFFVCGPVPPGVLQK